MLADELAKAEQILNGGKPRRVVIPDEDINDINTWSLITPIVPTIGTIFNNHLIYLEFTDGRFAEIMLGELPSVDKEINVHASREEFCNAAGYSSVDEFNRIGAMNVTQQELGQVIKKHLPSVKNVLLYKI